MNRREAIRSLMKLRPVECPNRKNCTPLAIVEYKKGFDCVGLSKKPRDLDCINLCIVVNGNEIDRLYMTLYEALMHSSIISMAVSNYYALFDNKEYAELMREMVKNGGKKGGD